MSENKEPKLITEVPGFDQAEYQARLEAEQATTQTMPLKAGNTVLGTPAQLARMQQRGPLPPQPGELPPAEQN